MIIFKDLITGDEMFTDSSKYNCVDDCIYEVECRHVGRKAEEEGEDTDVDVESGIDLVLNQRLVETSFSKADYKSYLKTYTKALQEKWKEIEMDERNIEYAKAKLTEAIKIVLPKLGDAQFFLGESSNPDGAVGLLEYREKDGSEVPIVIFLKHGLEEEKV